MGALSNAQLEILKLFRHDQSEEELKELKKTLVEYLAKRLSREIELECKEKGYTTEITDSWKDEHFRTPYK